MSKKIVHDFGTTSLEAVPEVIDGDLIITSRCGDDSITHTVDVEDFLGFLETVNDIVIKDTAKKLADAILGKEVVDKPECKVLQFKPDLGDTID